MHRPFNINMVTFFSVHKYVAIYHFWSKNETYEFHSRGLEVGLKSYEMKLSLKVFYTKGDQADKLV